ncbi:sensor histidine kinase [Glaciihabitans arcticus]|uniref:sensor histidine kinase n=1 Tax=Glaciihabitans arcticus TaxID=2668039 RepID=UPI003084508B
MERRWNAISLRTKMTGVSVLLLTLGLLAAGLGSMYVLRTYLTDEVDVKIKAFYPNINASVIDFDDSPEGVSCVVTSLPIAYYVAVLDSTGHVLCSNRSSPNARPNDSDVSKNFKTSNDEIFTVKGDATTAQWRVKTWPITMVQSGQYANIAVGLSLGETDAAIARFAAIFLFFGLTVVVVGAALTRLLVTSTFTPLREVETTAARFAAGDFSQRLSGATPNTEVGRLNRSLNVMLNRIDRAFADRSKTIDQMRRFVGDASHELRTPLVSVRGYAELYRMGALTTPEDVGQAMERIEKEAIRMGELVADLLELARIDEAKPLQLAAVDLVPIARDASLDAMAAAPDRPVTVVISLQPDPEPEPPEAEPVVEPESAASSPRTPGRQVSRATSPIAFAGATIARLRSLRARPVKPVDASVEVPELVERAHVLVLAEENKLRQVLTNLIGNAIRFSPAGGPIEIGVEVDENASLGILSVIDHGEGIPPQIRDKIFQRFWRADSSRNRDTGGSGLGLAIVAGIVAAHHGEVQIVETPGGGATFRVLLPLLQPGQELPAVTSSPI